MKRSPARTYDDILRRTVPEPDTGFRIPPAERHVRDAIVLGRVEEALRSIGHGDTGIEVVEGRAILRGSTRDLATCMLIEKAVAAVPGVEEVTNHLHAGDA
jgi:osmotically-inducible protein OsmY